MKNLFSLIVMLFLICVLIGCSEPAGKKAAKEGMDCMESAIDNASSLSSAQQAILQCQENLKNKYQDKINSDPAFAKDFMDVGNSNKDFEKKLAEKIKAKFGTNTN
jgi:hypothetical protein